MTKPFTLECDIHFLRRGRGNRKVLSQGDSLSIPRRFPGRIPRIAKFMALAIRFEQLIRAGEVTDYAELARLGQVTRKGHSDYEFTASVARNSGGIAVPSQN